MPHDEGLPNFCLEIFLKGLEKSRKAGIREKKKKKVKTAEGGRHPAGPIPPAPPHTPARHAMTGT